jgi:PhzF family phenazine biosynthesis protein
MPYEIAIVDAFTSTPFKGNPAAVCLLDREMPEDLMQRIAAEMNLSETAFLRLDGERYGLRWFTPAVEVDLCGHATIATAKYLYSEGIVPKNKTIEFNTRSGILSAAPVSTGSQELISLDFPAIRSEVIDAGPALAEALGAETIKVRRGRLDYLAILQSDDIVRNLKPDFTALAQIKARGIVVTAKAAEGRDYDFVSRGFFPQSGIMEDPVTGSAHCMLAPYWSEVLGKTSMRGYQASARGGYIGLELRGDRVDLIGDAVIVHKGQLLI